MVDKLSLMCVLADPDDESLGIGGPLTSAGIKTYLLTATRGKRGRVGDKRESLSLDAAGKIRATSYWPAVWCAVSCHKSQMAIYRQLEHLPEEHHKALWGLQEYYRVFSLVNGGRQRESDLFEGLR